MHIPKYARNLLRSGCGYTNPQTQCFGNIHVVVTSDNDSLQCHKLGSWQFSVFGVVSVINNRYSATRGERNRMTSPPHVLSNIYVIVQTWVLNMDLVFPGKHNLSQLIVLVIVYVRTPIQFTHIDPALCIICIQSTTYTLIVPQQEAKNLGSSAN